MSISDFLSGSVIPPAPTGSDTSTNYPLWYQDYLYNVANSATNLAQQPYTPFPGQQVATPSAATQQSWQMATGQANAGQGALNQAQSTISNASQPLTQAQINQYLNPEQSYITGALNKNLQENILPGLQSQFVSAGQAASPQQAQIENQAVYNTQQAAGQALAQGYQGALNTATQQQQVGISGGSALGQIGIGQQQVGAADTGLVAAAGQGQDIVGQANINAALNNFYAQQQWPYQQLGYASNAIRGIQLPTTSQTAGVGTVPATYAPGPIASFVGATTAANGLSNSLGLGHAKGGHIRKEQARGEYTHTPSRGGALERYARAA